MRGGPKDLDFAACPFPVTPVQEKTQVGTLHTQTSGLQPCLMDILSQKVSGDPEEHFNEPASCMQEWQIDVPWPDEADAPWELLKWFAEVLQRSGVADEARMQKQK